jgi:hypothetical protein
MSRARAEEAIDLTQPSLDRDDLRGLLLHEVLPEAILLVHLDHQPTEVANPLLAIADKRAALSPQPAGRR